MSAWVKMNNAQGQLMGITGEKFWWWEYDVAWINVVDGKYTFNNIYKKNSMQNGIDAEVATDQEVEVGKWAFVTLVFDKESNTRSLYYNGELLASSTIGGTDGLAWPRTQPAVFFVGKGMSEGTTQIPTYDASVDVDEVQVWTRALTADEIKASMTQVDTQASGLCYLYRFTEKNDDNTYNNLSPAGEAKAALYQGETGWDGYALTYNPAIIEAESVPGHTSGETPEEGFKVSWSNSSYGSIEVKEGDKALQPGVVVKPNTEITVTAVPNANFVLDSLKVNGKMFESGSTYVVTSDTRLEAWFRYAPAEQEYTLTITQTKGGKVTVMSGEEELSDGATVKGGTVITILATADKNYKIDKILVGGSEIQNGLNVTVASDLAITAQFSEDIKPQYTLTYTFIGEEFTNKLQVEDYDGTVLESPAKLDEGATFYVRGEVKNDKCVVKVAIDGKEEEVTLQSDLTFVYGAEISKDTDMTVTVTDHTGIEAAEAAVRPYYEAGCLFVTAPATVEVFDLSGRVVVRADVEHVLSLENLASGIYVAVINGETLKFAR